MRCACAYQLKKTNRANRLLTLTFQYALRNRFIWVEQQKSGCFVWKEDEYYSSNNLLFDFMWIGWGRTDNSYRLHQKTQLKNKWTAVRKSYSANESTFISIEHEFFIFDQSCISIQTFTGADYTGTNWLLPRLRLTKVWRSYVGSPF